MTVEEKLAQAFKETFDERTERIMKIEKKHRFSLAYRLWERKMLHDIRRGRCNGRWTLKKARYAVAALIAVFSLLIGGTAYAAVIIIGRYGFENKVDYSKMLIETHPSDKTTFEEYYGLPEEDDWKCTDSYAGTAFTTLNYERGDIKISFVQRIIHEGNMGQINTEKADIEMLSLYSENDGFVLEFRDDWSSMYWIHDGYLLEIDGNLNKTEMMNLAYSTKIIDSTIIF